MTIDINQFWSQLTDSQLIPASRIQAFFAEFSRDSTLAKTPARLAQWLVEQKAISDYQAKILLNGQSGPFQFGSYTIFQRIESGPLSGGFLGRHTPTGYPVLLQFLPGSVAADLDAWEDIENQVEVLTSLQHPDLTETFEAVVLPDHRLVVSQFPRGTTLATKLPPKGRLAWQKTCELIAHVTRGLDQLHNAGLVHRSIDLEKIWLEKNGVAQLRYSPLDDCEPNLLISNDSPGKSRFDYVAPEAFEESTQATPSSDLYSIGCLMFRMISGSPPFPESDPKKKKRLHLTQPPPALTKYELPDDLQRLLEKMMAKDPADRPHSASEVSNLLALFSGESEKINAATLAADPVRLDYRKSLAQYMPSIPTQPLSNFPTIVEKTETAESSGMTETPPSRQLTTDGDTASRVKSAAEKARRRRRNLWLAPMAVALILFVAAIGTSFWELRKNRATTDNAIGSNNPDVDHQVDTSPPSETDVSPSTASPSGRTLVVDQQLINDDNESLWETPTTGPNIEFSFLPPSPKLLFAFRVADLIEQPEGQRLIKSMGETFGARVDRFSTQSGVELANIDQLIVSLHSNDDFQFDSFFIVRMLQPVAAQHLIQRWNRPVLRTLENGQEIYESRNGDTAYYVLAGASPETGAAETGLPPSDEISFFVFGKKELVEQVAQSVEGNALSGSLRKIASWTDQDRHFSFLFLRNALFNDEGQHWMGESLKDLNRELSILIPDEVRGGLVSFHIDSGNYFEIMLDKNVDLKSVELKQIMQDELRSRREQLTQFIAGIAPNPYWDKVRYRYDNMLSDVARKLRWNIEHGELIANCWLPPMAAHNLIGASELVLTFSSGSSAPITPADSGPQTLEDLLATKRDLNIANPPDLNVLLLDLQNEINDDYRDLPFEFRIRLIGGDLQKEGITKNQRPNDLVMEQKTLAEILTSIMTGANPAKDITGPEDPNCKLIWVIAEDPENQGEKAILITTRAAAIENSYTLPPAFRTE